MILGSAQVLTLVKPYLMAFGRRDTLRRVKDETLQLAFDAEKEWFGVAEGQFSDPEIYNLTIQFRRRASEVLTKNMGDDPLPVNSKFIRLASASAERYIGNCFN